MKTLLFFFFVVLPGVLSAQSGLPSQPYIYVEGKAETQKPADIVTLSFSIVARGPQLSKANAEVQAKANKVFAMLKEREISDKDVTARDFRSEPQYEREENYPKRGKVIGYAVSRPFEVKVRDIKIFPKLVDDLVALGTTEFDAINGGLAKENEIQSEMWDKAVANAREQAEKTLKAMNMTVDSLFAISPVPIPEISSTMFPKDRAQAEAERVIVTGSNIPTAEEAGPSQYRVPPVSVTQIVHVIYLISPIK